MTTPRTAVITGASSGIGAATARQLRAQGWQVVAFARRADRLAALAEECGVHVVVGDVTSAGDVAQLVARAGEMRVDAIINVAGFALGTDPVEDAELGDWQAMWDANVLGTVRVTQALLPLLRDAGGGDIVLVTSTAGHGTYPGGGGYVATKHAMASVAATLRLELAGEPIRVVEIAPGMVHTAEFSLTRFRGDSAQADAVYQGVDDPLTAADVAEVIAFAVTRPAHVNLDLITIRPVAQSSHTQVARYPLRVRSGKLTA